MQPGGPPRRPSSSSRYGFYPQLDAGTIDGRPLRMLTLMDEYTRERLETEVVRHPTSEPVLERPAESLIVRGPPDFIRSDNGWG